MKTLLAMVQQRRKVRNLKVGDHGYVAGIVDYAASEEQRNNAALGYTAQEWKGLIGNGKDYPLRLDHDKAVGQLVQSSVDDQNQLWVHALFDLNSDLGRQTWERVKTGELHSFSIGFDALQTVQFNEAGAPKRYVLDFQEVSVTDKPRKKHAKILYRASEATGEQVLPEEAREVTAPAVEAPIAEPAKVDEPPIAVPPAVAVPPVVAEPMQVDAPVPPPADAPVIEPPQLLEAAKPSNATLNTDPPQPTMSASPPQDQSSSAPMAVDPAPPTPVSTPVPALDQVPAPVTASLLKQELEAARAAREELAAARAERAELAELKLKKAQKAEERRAKAQADRMERMKASASVTAQYQKEAGLDDAEAEVLQQEMANNEIGGRFLDSYAALAARLKAVEEEKIARELELEQYRSIQMGDRKRVALPPAPTPTADDVKRVIDLTSLPQKVNAARLRMAGGAAAAAPKSGLDTLHSMHESQLAQATAHMNALLKQQADAEAAAAAEEAEPEVPVEYEQLDQAQSDEEYYDVLYRMWLKGINPPKAVRCSGSNLTLEDAESRTGVVTKQEEFAIPREDRLAPLIAEALYGERSRYIDSYVADRDAFKQGRRMTGIKISKPKPDDNSRERAMRQHQENLMRQHMMAQANTGRSFYR